MSKANNTVKFSKAFSELNGNQKNAVAEIVKVAYENKITIDAYKHLYGQLTIEQKQEAIERLKNEASNE